MATTPTYDSKSPYAKTNMFGNYLDVTTFVAIPKLADDVLFTVNRTYQYRPDLLAFDLYGDANLWWVFAMRNPDIVKDSIFDLKIGTKFFVPKKTTLTKVLGM